MLKLDKITFSYGQKKILENFSLQINKNDRLWICGESGRGKTTLIRLILGLENPQGGSITNDNSWKPSVVFQEDRLLPFKTALQNILLVKNDRQRAIESLTALGIGNDIDTNINELSGGMKRRVAIARALTADFDYLILDEPFTGLDQDNIEATVTQILKVAQDKPIILITHSPWEAQLFNAKKIEL